MEKVIIAIVLCVTSFIFGQNKDQNLYDGTTAFEGKDFILHPSGKIDFKY